jgi:hypothetical protein
VTKQKELQAVIFLTVVLCASSAASVALGAGSCGSCNLPAELQQAGRKLEVSFAAATLDDLRTQRWSGALCSFHPCEAGVTEELAKELLVEFLQDQDNKDQRWFAWAGFGLGVLGLLIALFAMVWTVINDRRSRAANDRSIRNEVLIETMREERK